MWYLRILTASTDSEVEARIRKRLATILNRYAYHVSPMQPYWKFEGWGELGVVMQGIDDIETVAAQLAVHWKGEVADRRWTEFCDEGIEFMWLTEG